MRHRVWAARPLAGGWYKNDAMLAVAGSGGGEIESSVRRRAATSQESIPQQSGSRL
jgi:hypothetical protein